MKKFASILLVMVLALVTLTVSAEDAAITVFVTIANGELLLACEPVEVTDIDEDGVLTINDALYCAHELYFEGGAAENYGSAMTEYGLTLTKLGGVDNGISYGYYVNNASAWSLADAINEYDFINAFVYTDVTSFSDTYCWFEDSSSDGLTENEITLTLYSAGWDENWAPVAIPVEGAVITFDDIATEYITGADGSVTIAVPDADMTVVSAISETMNMVPPAFLIISDAE